MKRPVLLIFCLIVVLNGLSLRLIAQSRLYIYIRNIADYDHVARYAPTNTPKQSPIIPNDQPEKYLWESDELDIYRRSIAVIRFYDESSQKLLTLSEVDPGNTLRVDIIVGTQPVHTLQIAGTSRDMTDLNVDFANLNGFVTRGDQPLTISVRIQNPNYRLVNYVGDVNTAVAKGTYHSKSLEFYQSFGGSDLKGFWIPLLQFSSNLQSTAEGIPFASLPIGLGWGVKKIGRRGGYIGVTLMGNWLFYNQPDNIPNADVNSFTVSALTYGGMIDINNVITIGGVYGNDLRKDQADPGFMFVLGFGPRLMIFLKDGK